MKKKILILMGVMCFLMSQAQEVKNDINEVRKEKHEKMSNLTPEQAAELSTKKLTLALDLSETQQKEVMSLQLDRAKKHQEMRKLKAGKKEMTNEERFKIKTARMDAQIALKAKMKDILTEDQYKKWEKMSRTRRGKAFKAKDGKHPRKKQG
jgi:protein CpxP